MGSCTQVQELKEAPGSKLFISSALATLAIWGADGKPFSLSPSLAVKAAVEIKILKERRRKRKSSTSSFTPLITSVHCTDPKPRAQSGSTWLAVCQFLKPHKLPPVVFNGGRKQEPETRAGNQTQISRYGMQISKALHQMPAPTCRG